MISLKNECEFDPKSAQRIANVIEWHPMSLRNCADILEFIAPLCTIFTTDGCIHKIAETFNLYLED